MLTPAFVVPGAILLHALCRCVNCAAVVGWRLDVLLNSGEPHNLTPRVRTLPWQDDVSAAKAWFAQLCGSGPPPSPVRISSLFWLFIVAFNLVRKINRIVGYCHAVQVGLPAYAEWPGATYAAPILYPLALMITYIAASTFRCVLSPERAGTTRATSRIVDRIE